MYNISLPNNLNNSYSNLYQSYIQSNLNYVHNSQNNILKNYSFSNISNIPFQSQIPQIFEVPKQRLNLSFINRAPSPIPSRRQVIDLNNNKIKYKLPFRSPINYHKFNGNYSNNINNIIFHNMNSNISNNIPQMNYSMVRNASPNPINLRINNNKMFPLIQNSPSSFNIENGEHKLARTPEPRRNYNINNINYFKSKNYNNYNINYFFNNYKNLNNSFDKYQYEPIKKLSNPNIRNINVNNKNLNNSEINNQNISNSDINNQNINNLDVNNQNINYSDINNQNINNSDINNKNINNPNIYNNNYNYNINNLNSQNQNYINLEPITNINQNFDGNKNEQKNQNNFNYTNYKNKLKNHNNIQIIHVNQNMPNNEKVSNNPINEKINYNNHNLLIDNQTSDYNVYDKNSPAIINNKNQNQNQNKNQLLNSDNQNPLNIIQIPININHAKSGEKESVGDKIVPKNNFNPSEFKIEKQIGEGTFGKIYTVKWIKNNEFYALKKLNLIGQNELKYFQRKVKIVQDLIEKTGINGLTKIYGDKVIPSNRNNEYRYYVLMELIEIDWEVELKQRKALLKYYSENELLEIIFQLVRTLTIMQRNNVTHRDIKPQNVLVSKGVYKLCDFGEVKIIEGDGPIMQPVRGSELYMSPILFYAYNGQVSTVLHNTYKSDVFSLGMCILLASSLSARTLCEIREIKNMNVISKIITKAIIDRYSQNIINLIIKMLQIDENLRFDFLELSQYIYNLWKVNI